MRIDCPVRLADRTKTEVVAPTGKEPIELRHLQPVSIDSRRRLVNSLMVRRTLAMLFFAGRVPI